MKTCAIVDLNFVLLPSRDDDDDDDQATTAAAGAAATAEFTNTQI